MHRLLIAVGLFVVGLVPTIAVREGAIDFNAKPDQSVVVQQTPDFIATNFEKTYWCQGCNEVDVPIRSVCKICGHTERLAWWSIRVIDVDTRSFFSAPVYQFSGNGHLHANFKHADKIPEKFTINGSDKIYHRSQVLLTGRPKFE